MQWAAVTTTRGAMYVPVHSSQPPLSVLIRTATACGNCFSVLPRTMSSLSEPTAASLLDDLSSTLAPHAASTVPTKPKTAMRKFTCRPPGVDSSLVQSKCQRAREAEFCFQQEIAGRRVHKSHAACTTRRECVRVVRE